MSLITLKPSEYQAFSQQCQTGSFMQSQAMANLLSKRGYEIRILGLKIDGELQVAGFLFCQAVTGGLRMEMNSGPLFKDSQYLKTFYQELKTYAKLNGAIELVLKPYETYQVFDTNGQASEPEVQQFLNNLTDLDYQHDGLTTGYPGGEPDWHYVKDLTGLTPDTLVKSFSKKGRPLVNKAKSFGIKTRILSREELSDFKAITAATSERRDYVDKPLDYYQDLYDAFGEQAQFIVATLNFQDYLANLKNDRQNIEVKRQQSQENLLAYPGSAKHKKALAEIENQLSTFDTRIEEAENLLKQYGQTDLILAGALFIYASQETVYLFSGSYPEFNRFYAPAILQIAAMEESIKRGITTYNFLGITGHFDNSDSVLRFKQNFNGYITRKMGTFRYYPHPLKYKIIQTIKKLLGRL